MSGYLLSWLALHHDREAVTAIEYALIAGVLVATLVLGFSVFVTDLSNKFIDIGGSL